jgi:hypothetical protein
MVIKVHRRIHNTDDEQKRFALSLRTSASMSFSKNPTTISTRQRYCHVACIDYTKDIAFSKCKQRANDALQVKSMFYGPFGLRKY